MATIFRFNSYLLRRDFIFGLKVSIGMQGHDRS